MTVRHAVHIISHNILADIGCQLHQGAILESYLSASRTAGFIPPKASTSFTIRDLCACGSISEVRMTRLSPTVMTLALLVMVVVCSSFSSCAAAIDPNRDCSNKFPKLNYKPVTSVCKPKVPATKACCAAFNKLACRYRSQVNNFRSICPILFMAYLNYAGGYQDGYFIGKCIDGKKGLCA